MLRTTTRVSLVAIALACAPGLSQGQPATPPEKAGTTPQATMAEHVAALRAQCPPATRLPEAEAAKLLIHVTRWGTTGPTVLIVHGGVQGRLGGGPSTFARQEPLAAQGWRLALVERPGFGESPSRGADDMEADARWIADMLGDGANLIGHSWGGAEALLAAARRPEAVRSLVLIEPALAPLLMGDPRFESDPAAKAEVTGVTRALLAAGSPREYGLVFAHSLGAMGAQGGAPNAAAADFEADPQQATNSGCALLQGRMASVAEMRQAAETLAKAKVPVLVVTGGWSPARSAVGDVLARLTGGRHVIVRSPNHFVQSANADDFNKVVDAFMREADRNGPPTSDGKPKDNKSP